MTHCILWFLTMVVSMVFAQVYTLPLSTSTSTNNFMVSRNSVPSSKFINNGFYGNSWLSASPSFGATAAAPTWSFGAAATPTWSVGAAAAPTWSFGAAAPTYSFGAAAPTYSFVGSGATPTYSFVGGGAAAPTYSFVGGAPPTFGTGHNINTGTTFGAGLSSGLGASLTAGLGAGPVSVPAIYGPISGWLLSQSSLGTTATSVSGATYGRSVSSDATVGSAVNGLPSGASDMGPSTLIPGGFVSSVRYGP